MRVQNNFNYPNNKPQHFGDATVVIEKNAAKFKEYWKDMLLFKDLKNMIKSVGSEININIGRALEADTFSVMVKNSQTGKEANPLKFHIDRSGFATFFASEDAKRVLNRIESIQ